MAKNTKMSQQERARAGAIGENLVIAKLMQQGWDAFNANVTIKNCKSIDLVCFNGDKSNPDKPYQPAYSLIQVKTCRQKNIPAGFTIGQCLDKEFLKNNIMGPYVFIYAKDTEYRYFIISRNDVIELLYQGHIFYVDGYNRNIDENTNSNEKRNGISLNSMAGLPIRWLEGKSEPATNKHCAFINPFDGISFENQWDNIWKD